MKKLIVLFTLILYITSTNGMVQSSHFCMNEKLGTDFSLSSNEQHKCPRCGMTEKQKGCCSNEQSIVKLDTNHQNSEVIFEAPVFFLIALDVPCFLSDSSEKLLKYPSNIASYSEGSVPIYIRDCSYLI